MLTTPLTSQTSHSPFVKRTGDATEALKRSKEFDREYFTEENYKYDQWHLDQSRWIVSYMFDYVRPKPDWVYLDIGCALGGVVEMLRRRKVEGYGIDISQYCLKESTMKEYLRLGSATNIPCADKSVDISICIDTFQYLSKQEVKKAISELKRVTKRYVFFETLTKEDILSKQDRNPDRQRKGQSLLSKKEILKLFKEEGFFAEVTGWLPRHIDGCWLGHGWYEYDFSFNALFEVE